MCAMLLASALSSNFEGGLGSKARDERVAPEYSPQEKHTFCGFRSLTESSAMVKWLDELLYIECKTCLLGPGVDPPFA
jgi:hypothetical protein